MFNRPTVLVLGAGASVPFGFPTGLGLVAQICNANYRNHESISPLKEQFPLFQDALRKSGLSSIDSFLENRVDDFAEIGKRTICREILSIERYGKSVSKKETYLKPVYESNLFGFDGNWYRQLRDLLGLDTDKFGANLAIITFNYDRSLEQFIFTSIKNSFKLSDEECASLLSRIKIVHVYGSVGELDWQNLDSGIEYGADPKSEAIISRAANNINVIRKDEIPHTFEQATDLLQQAQFIYFFGFGFNEDNIKRLELKKMGKNANTAGTRLGIRGETWRRVMHHLKISSDGGSRNFDENYWQDIPIDDYIRDIGFRNLV